MTLPQGRRLPDRPHRDGVPAALSGSHVIASWRSEPLPLAPWLPATRSAQSPLVCHVCHLVPRLCVLPSRDREGQAPTRLSAVLFPYAAPASTLISPCDLPSNRVLLLASLAPSFHYVLARCDSKVHFPTCTPLASRASQFPPQSLAAYCPRTLPPRSRFPNAGHARSPARAPSARHSTDHLPPQVQRTPFYCIDPGQVVQPRIFPFKRRT